MNFPDKLKIRPLEVPIQASVSIPGSKSLTNRSLILAALAKGETSLKGALWSEDTQYMTEALEKLGFKIKVTNDPANTCNRTITLEGQGGIIPAQTADIYVGTAGTAARFLSAFCSLGKGSYHLHGTERMHRRPMKAIFDALRELGADIADSSGFLPATIRGPIKPGNKIKIEDSGTSQFASALLLISKIAHLEVECENSPYVEMTRYLLNEWETPKNVRDVEFDASSASYFAALPWIHSGNLTFLQKQPTTATQIDSVIFNPELLGKLLTQNDEFTISRKNEIGDAVLTLIVAAAALKRPLHLKDAQNLRLQESDRITAMVTELKKCGCDVEEHEEGLTLKSTHRFQAAQIETYNDHRIAMCFALLGTLNVFGNGEPWITILNPSCVEKTFPNFFETLEETARVSYAHAKIPFPGIVLDSESNPLIRS
jgi:3-phosphoshikimate 1-carboxyvinyltransferase